jgi:hypothetical protein
VIARAGLVGVLCVVLAVLSPAAGLGRTSHRHTHSVRFASRRDGRARAAFKAASPCPVTGRSRGRCPGYVIDHVHALKHGGRDDASNMQWQTIQAAKAKDSIE